MGDQRREYGEASRQVTAGLLDELGPTEEPAEVYEWGLRVWRRIYREAREKEEALAADEANCQEDDPERVECGALMADFGRAG